MCALRSPRELLKQPIYELLEIERNLTNKKKISKNSSTIKILINYTIITNTNQFATLKTITQAKLRRSRLSQCVPVIPLNMTGAHVSAPSSISKTSDALPTKQSFADEHSSNWGFAKDCTHPSDIYTSIYLHHHLQSSPIF